MNFYIFRVLLVFFLFSSPICLGQKEAPLVRAINTTNGQTKVIGSFKKSELMAYGSYGNRNFTFQALPNPGQKYREVRFYLDGLLVSTDDKAPFILTTDYEKNPAWLHGYGEFDLEVVAILDAPGKQYTRVFRDSFTFSWYEDARVTNRPPLRGEESMVFLAYQEGGKFKFLTDLNRENFVVDYNNKAHSNLYIMHGHGKKFSSASFHINGLLHRVAKHHPTIQSLNVALEPEPIKFLPGIYDLKVSVKKEDGGQAISKARIAVKNYPNIFMTRKSVMEKDSQAAFLVRANDKSIAMLTTLSFRPIVIDPSQHGEFTVLYRSKKKLGKVEFYNSLGKLLRVDDSPPYTLTEEEGGGLKPFKNYAKGETSIVVKPYDKKGNKLVSRVYKFSIGKVPPFSANKGSKPSAPDKNQDRGVIIVKDGNTVVERKYVHRGDVIQVPDGKSCFLEFEPSSPLLVMNVYDGKEWIGHDEFKQGDGPKQIAIPPAAGEQKINVKAEIKAGGFMEIFSFTLKRSAKPARAVASVHKPGANKSAATPSAFKRSIDWNKIFSAKSDLKFETLGASSVSDVLPTRVTFKGPKIGAKAELNPFMEVDIEITFQKGGLSITRPAFFAADGKAADSGASTGSVWQANVCFPESGTWQWSVSAKAGHLLCVDSNATAYAIKGLDGKKGSIAVAKGRVPSKSIYAKGKLVRTDKRYLMFEKGGYFIKNSLASPEGFLASKDISGAETNAIDFSKHASSWRSSQPVWAGGKGKGVIGAINYASQSAINCLSLVIDNRDSSTPNVWPYKSSIAVNKFDPAKLAQWEKIFDHAQKQGLVLEFIFQDSSYVTDADLSKALDFGEVDKEWRLLVREMVARFGHYPGVIWNMGMGNRQQLDSQLELGSLMRKFVGKEAHVVIGVTKDRQRIVYPRLISGESLFSGVSVQTDWSRGYRDVNEWVSRTSLGSNWVVSYDRVSPDKDGIPVDITHSSYKRRSDGASTQDRRGGLIWGSLMAGSGGFSTFFGTEGAESHFTSGDLSTREVWWDMCRAATNFYERYLPFAEMKPMNELIDNKRSRREKGYCLGKKDEVYAIYLPEVKAAPTLDLTGDSLSFEVRWYDPKSGGGLQTGSVPSVSSGGKVSLGMPPLSARSDWVILVTKGGDVKGGLSLK